MIKNNNLKPYYTFLSLPLKITIALRWNPGKDVVKKAAECAGKACNDFLKSSAANTAVNAPDDSATPPPVNPHPMPKGPTSDPATLLVKPPGKDLLDTMPPPIKTGHVTSLKENVLGKEVSSSCTKMDLTNPAFDNLKKMVINYPTPNQSDKSQEPSTSTSVSVPHGVVQTSQRYVDMKLAQPNIKLVQASAEETLKSMVLHVDDQRIKHHAAVDHFVAKYIPLYQQHHANIVCLIQNPMPLSGVFTMSKDKFDKIEQGTDGLLDTLTYEIMFYCDHMYGRSITTETDIASRISSLLTNDPSYRYMYPKECVHGYESSFPIRQHLLTADSHNLGLRVTNLNISPEITITQEYLTFTKYLEINTLQKTHGFIFSQKMDVILVNDQDKNHTNLCQLNSPKFVNIMGQRNPDFIACPRPFLIAIPGNELSAIPIDVKLHSLPEQSIPFYNSYSTLSPCLQKDVFVHRSKVCAEAHLKKMEANGLSIEIHNNVKDYIKELQKISLQVKNKKMTSDQGYHILKTLNQQVICESDKYNLYPTFIETATFNPHFNFSWDKDQATYEKCFHNVRLLVKENVFIIFQNKHTYNSYAFDLFIQKVLHQMRSVGPDYLEQYRNLRGTATIIL